MVAPNALTPEFSRKANRKLQKKKKKLMNSLFTKTTGNVAKVDVNVNKNGSNNLFKSASSPQGKNRISESQIGKVPKQKFQQKGNTGAVQGPSFKQNSSARYAALEEYVKNEVSKEKKFENINSADVQVSSSQKKGKSRKNTIKDKVKLDELQNGIEKDDREINFLQRQLQHNARQKKSNNMLRNIFGSEIGDLFDALEAEPTEADLLHQKPLESPKVPNAVKKGPKLELPKNTIFVETSKIGSEGPSPVNSPSPNKASKKRPLEDSDEDASLVGLPQNKKLNKNSTIQGRTNVKSGQVPVSPNGRESSMPLKKKRKTSPIKGSPEQMKSIINTKGKKFMKKSRALNVSFDLSKNEVRIIPSIVKESGFTVMDDNTPLFCDEEADFVSNAVESDDSDEISEASNNSDEDFAMDRLYNSPSDLYLAKKKKLCRKSAENIQSWKTNFEQMCDSNFTNTSPIVKQARKERGSGGRKDVHSERESSDESSPKYKKQIRDDSFDRSVSDSCSEGENSSESDFDSDMPSDSDEDMGSNDSDLDVPAQNNNLSEDIYGRILDSEGNVVETTTSDGPSTYLTPAKRKLDETLQQQLNDDAIKRVRTQLRGRLNRLAEANLAGAVTMVCSLYETHPRHLLNVVLSELLLAELAGETPTLDRHCQECAVLLTALASNVAEEIGAHILTDFVISWHEEMQKGADASCARLRNCLMFVCHLFSFGLLHSALLYDLLRRLATSFSANAVEQMMVVVGSVGFLLRKEDPLALKDFIVAVQSQGVSCNFPQFQLLSTMLRAVKNNNESKMPDYDPTYTEHLRKLLKSYVGGDVRVTPLRVTLEDLLHSETRGRWWIVGSAYSGQGALATPSQVPKPSKALSTETKFSADFMKMAESMRISRPPKINILFALTVGSESVAEAIIKLKELSLSPTQEKLIFDVMLFCIQKMRAYKPFYAILSIRLCVSEGKYKRLLQHALWDKFTDLDALKSKELKHLAKFIVHTVKEDALNLSVLKTLPFVDTNRKIVDFLEDIFCQLFTDEGGDQVSISAFEKLFLSKKLEPLRRQFSLFLQLFMLPKCEAGELDARCRARVQRVLDMLGSEGGLLF